MTRKEIKDLLPIMQAYVEGKTIQYRVYKEWEDIDNPSFNDLPSEYRIKPEPTYRPFKDKEECWNEMLKHQPFGWVKNGAAQYINALSIGDDKNFSDWFKLYIFADGTPFGVKEEQLWKNYGQQGIKAVLYIYMQDLNHINEILFGIVLWQI